MEKEEIKVGDYVEPIFEEFKDIDMEMNSEDLYGFVIAKNKNLITIRSIGNEDVESTWNEKRFKVGVVPEIFKDETKTR